MGSKASTPAPPPPPEPYRPPGVETGISDSEITRSNGLYSARGRTARSRGELNRLLALDVADAQQPTGPREPFNNRGPGDPNYKPARRNEEVLGRLSQRR